MRLRHRKWADEVLAENKDIGQNLADLEDVSVIADFKNLEIGSGLGGFLLELSRRHPENKYLGVEINKNAFAMEIKAGAKVKKEQTNFLFLNAPIERIFPLLKDGQLDNLYINFPDPWPKNKQKKKRLSYPTRLAEYLRFLSDDGTLYFRTDNIDLFEDSITYFMRSGFKHLQIIRPFYSEKVDYLPGTEYERKFREKGTDINLIIAHK
jgi:tRNA (guanine-N7-)-methyltransferase